MVIGNTIINSDNIVKIYRNKNTSEYEAILDVDINISGNQTNVMKKLGVFDYEKLVNLLDKKFMIVDKELIFNINKIMYITNYEDFLYITTSVKKEMRNIYKNYNIKVSGYSKSQEIFNKLKNLGVEVSDKEFNEVIININHVNNIVVESNRIIINFITNVSLNNSFDVIPTFEIQYFRNDLEKQEILADLISGNPQFYEVFYKGRTHFLNLDNVFLIKKDTARNRIIFNFKSNIYKEKFGKKVLSTVHVYDDYNTLEDMEKSFQGLLK
jgi:hypothetical protein